MHPLAQHGGFAAFRHRDFNAFYVARTFNALAIQMVDVAIGWTVYKLTESAFALGLVGLCIFLPNVLLALPAGQVADMFPRKYVIASCALLSTTAALGLFHRGRVAVHDRASAVCAHRGVRRRARVFRGGRASAHAEPRAAGNIANAIALSSSAYQTATIAGPAIGGLLYAFGPEVVFGATAACYRRELRFLQFLTRRPVLNRPERLSFRYMTAGIRFIFSKPIILGAITVDLFAVLLGGATALLPVFAADIFLVDPFGLGLLRSAPAVGAFSTSLLLAHMPLQRRVGLRLFQVVAVRAGDDRLRSLQQFLSRAVLPLRARRLLDMVSVYIRSSLIQIDTPDEMRGRVAAVNGVFVGASNEFGVFESGTLAAGCIGPGAGGGVRLRRYGTILVAFICARKFPALYRRDTLA